MSDPTLENLKALIADIICMEAADINPPDTFAALGFDSLDHAQLINECEDHFEIEISDEDAIQCLTVSTLYDVITRAHYQTSSPRR